MSTPSATSGSAGCSAAACGTAPSAVFASTATPYASSSAFRLEPASAGSFQLRLAAGRPAFQTARGVLTVQAYFHTPVHWLLPCELLCAHARGTHLQPGPLRHMQAPTASPRRRPRRAALRARRTQGAAAGRPGSPAPRRPGFGASAARALPRPRPHTPGPAWSAHRSLTKCCKLRLHLWCRCVQATATGRCRMGRQPAVSLAVSTSSQHGICENTIRPMARLRCSSLEPTQGAALCHQQRTGALSAQSVRLTGKRLPCLRSSCL